MQSIKEYTVPNTESRCELEIKKSKFIGSCFPVESEGQAGEILERVRKAHWDANHNCYAYRIGPGGSGMRSSDDGEPAGTAGMPILNVLIKENVTNVLCIVTRYFGGILLGAGGLVRAYTAAAGDALKEAGRAVMCPCALYEAMVPYALWQQTERAIREFGQIQEAAYTEQVTASYWVPLKEAQTATDHLTDLTDGRVRPIKICEQMRPLGDAWNSGE